MTTPSILYASRASTSDAGGFVTSGDVAAKKRALKPRADAIDAMAVACSALNASTRAAWDGFYADWRDWLATDASFWSAAHEMDRTEQYERDIEAWNKKIGGDCGGSPLPDIEPPPKTAIEEVIGRVTWIAAIGAGLYVAHETGALGAIARALRGKK